MKNDIKILKNEVLEKETKRQNKENIKEHQRRLKDNLATEIIRLLSYEGQPPLYILENKEQIILHTIKTTQEQERALLVDEDSKAFDFLAEEEKQIHHFLLGTDRQESKKNDDSSDDLIYLYDCFFAIYSKIEKEENKKQKLKAEARQEKLKRIIINIINFSLEQAEKKGVSKRQGILKFKTLKAKNIIFESITNDLEEENYTIEELKKAYNKVLKDLLNDYKYEEEPSLQQENVKLHWVWKANLIFDTVRALFKHF